MSRKRHSNEKTTDLNMNKYLAELLGTFALVFCGTGAIIINQQYGGGVTHVGIAITFGLIVMAIIYALATFQEHTWTLL